MSRKPSYFDEDYDEKVKNKKSFDIKAFFQVILLYIVMGIKWLRDTAVAIYQKLQGDEVEYTPVEPSEAVDDDIDIGIAPPEPSLAEKTSKNQVDEIEKIRHRAVTEQQVRVRKAPSKGVRIIVPILMFVFTIGCIVAIIGTFMISFTKENNKIMKFNADASAVCAEHIKDFGATNYENLYTNYKVEGYRMTGLSYARELDFDNDGTSELLICDNDNGEYYVTVYAYVDGKFQSIYHGKTAQTSNKADDVWITLYYHSNKYLIGEHDEKDLSKVTLLAMRGDKFVKRNTAEYDAQAQAFTIRKKVDYESFERIKLSVLREEKAFLTLERVTDTIDGFQSNTVSSAIMDENSEMDYKKAFKNVVDSHIQSYGEPEYKEESGLAYIDGVALVKLVDFDNDDKDELVIVYRKATKTRDEDSNGNYVSVIDHTYYTEVYSFNGKTAQMVYQKEGVCEKPNESDDLCLMIKNEGSKHYLCFNSFSYEDRGHIVNSTSTVLEYKKNKTFESVFNAKIYTEYNYSEYYIDDKTVSRSEFNEKGYQVPFFDGTSSYSSNSFDITYVQRTMSQSSNIKSIVDNTNSEIKKLS